LILEKIAILGQPPGECKKTMLFNSIEFAIFLPIVFFLYWFVINKNLKAQNLLVLISSYIFYGWWDWRFLSLIIFSSFTDYSVGIALSKEKNSTKRKLLLLTSIFVNIGFLGFFKYWNFFAESFADAFTLFGNNFEPDRLNIILPVGISFYTFQTLSYSIDVYRRKVEPTKDIIAFFSFVSFFPQLVAGPIERATNLLPQFYIKRQFDYKKAVDGMRQILWGLFKKMVIADNCAGFVNDFFANSADYSGSALLLGAIFFAFQIYCDFSGYSDIAIGTARLLGFNLMRNFAFPYFSRDIAEFWRRWHISLSSWFRDYLYIPLGGNRVSKLWNYRNLLIVFFITGLWHGASWSFVVWGLYHGFFLVGEKLLFGRGIKSLTSPFLRAVYVLPVVLIGWVIFRAESLTLAMSYLEVMLNPFNENSAGFSMAVQEVLTPFTIFTLALGSLSFFAPRKPTVGKMLTRQTGFTLDFARLIYVTLAIFFGAVIVLQSNFSPFLYFRF